MQYAMQTWDEPEHQWPSAELVSSVVSPTTSFQNSRILIARSVWNAVASFASIASWVEGGYLPLSAGNDNRMLPYFSEQIYPAVGLAKTGEVSDAFGALLMRDLYNGLAHSGLPYGPQGAYVMIDQHGYMLCIADNKGQPRRSFIQSALPQAAPLQLRAA